MIMVKEAFEFNAKRVKAPEAKITFVNAYDFYRVIDKNYTVSLKKNVTLSGQSSSDMVGSVETYTWTIPAGVKYTIIKGNITGTADKEADKITIQFTENLATYIKVDLVVTDSSGLTSKADSIWIKPDGAAPVLIEGKFTVKIVGKATYLDWPIAVDEDVEMEFNATAATDNGNITNWVWTFGDKTAPLNGKVVKHRYADPGIFDVSLKIVDAVGNELKLVNITKATVKDVTKPAPVIKPFSGEPKMGTKVELNASQSYDPRTTKNIETLANYSWTWFDRAANANVTVYGMVVKNYNFTMPGDYNFNLTVTDDAGLKGWTTRQLRIRGPDLEVRNVEYREPSVNKIQEGKKVKISIPIVNNGLVKVDDKWTLRVELAGKEIKEVEIDAVIDPSETYYYNFTFTPGISGRDKELKVTVDVNDDIPEEVEKPNEYKTKIDIKAKEPIIKWWWFFIALAILLVVYVIFMKVTRGEWGYEPVQKWWNNRKKN
jgi:PKD repeat protein